MKKVIIFLFYYILNIYLCYTESIVRIAPISYNFGTVIEGKIVKKEITVFNDSERTLNITMSPTCGCLVIGESKFLLNAHSSKKVTIKFNTNGYDGPIIKEIIINTDDPANSIFYFKIEGKVKKGLSNFYFYKPEKNYVIYTNNFIINMLDNPEILFYFSYNNCKQCEQILNKLIKWADIQNQHQKVNIYFYQLEDLYNKGHVYEISKRIGYYPKLPLVIYYQIYYSGEKQINSFINNDVNNDSNKKDLLSKFNPLTIFISGLIEGINPCAFTVIILLLSYFSFRFRAPKQILVAGIFYIIAVFITYFFVGIGIFEKIKMLQIFKIFSYILKYGLTLFLFVLAGLNIYDYFKARKKESDKMILKEKI